MDAALTKEITRSADLVSRIRQGDQRAEDEFVEHYHRGIWRIIKQDVRNHSDVNDLCQETFRMALEKIRRGDVREPEKLSAFITGLAKNIVIDYHRRMARRDDRHLNIEAAEQLADPAPSPLDEVLRKERTQIARQVISELPIARDRALLLRFYIIGDDKERICAELGLTSLQFNRVLFRALKRCRDLVQRRCGQSEPTGEKKSHS
jgi:RNA polymerase sigma-70 factor (ECF subfamily)